ncbi:MAG: hypothetical protein AAGA30_06870, partial [Planctomycetota bacterium]
MERYFTIIIFFSILLLISCRQQKSSEPRETKATVSKPTHKKTNPPIAAVRDSSEQESERTPITRSEIAEYIELVQRLSNGMELQIPNAWTQLPDWLQAESLPFDTNEYFQVNPDENGAKNIILALCFNANETLFRFMPKNRRPTEDRATPDQKRLWDLRTKVTGTRHRILDFVFDVQDEEAKLYFDSNFPTFRELVRWQAKELALADQKLKTFIPSNFSLDALPPASYNNIAWDLGALIVHDPNSDEAMNSLSQTLELQNLIRRLAGLITQLNSMRITRFATDTQAMTMIRSTDDSERLQKIIDLLEDSLADQYERPSFIEMARYEHLQLRKILHELHTDTFEPDPEILEYLSLHGDTPKLIVLQKMMTTDIFGSYFINVDFAKNTLRDRMKNQPDVMSRIEKVLEEPPETPLGPSRHDKAGAMMVTEIFHALSSMSHEDFELEIDVLNRRYREMEELRHLNTPDQIHKLKVLEKNWTTDGTWKSTKFLKWFHPLPHYANAACRAKFFLSGAITLAK